MPTLEERVAYLEGRLGDHDSAMDSLRQDYTRVVAGVHSLLANFRDQMLRGFEQVDRRFEQIEHRFEGVDGRFVGQDEKIDRHFMWLVGMHVAVLLAVVGALVGSYYK